MVLTCFVARIATSWYGSDMCTAGRMLRFHVSAATRQSTRIAKVTSQNLPTNVLALPSYSSINAEQTLYDRSQ
jgi:hypothetical protein